MSRVRPRSESFNSSENVFKNFDRFKPIVISDEDELFNIFEQGDKPFGPDGTPLGSAFSYLQDGYIGKKENMGIDFKELGIETIHSKKKNTRGEQGEKQDIDVTEELSIFIIVHGGKPIYKDDEDDQKRRNEVRGKIFNNLYIATRSFTKIYGHVSDLNMDIPVITSLGDRHTAFPWNADRIHTYTVMGKNVHINDLFPYLYYYMYCRENVIALILLYIIVEFHFYSPNNMNIYPYRKIYSNKRREPIKRKLLNKFGSPNKKPRSTVLFSNINRNHVNDNSDAYNSDPQDLNMPPQEEKRRQRFIEGDTSILNVRISFGIYHEMNESALTFVYTNRDSNKYKSYKINLKEFEKYDKYPTSHEYIIWELHKAGQLYLSDLMFYVDSIINKKQGLYISYNLVYCQGDVDEVEVLEEGHAQLNKKYIAKGYPLVTDKIKKDFEKGYALRSLKGSKKGFYRKIFDINKQRRSEWTGEYTLPIKTEKYILEHTTSIKTIMEEKHMFENTKKVLKPDENNFKKILDVLNEYIPRASSSIPPGLTGGGKNKQKKNKSKSKQEKKKIKSKSKEENKKIKKVTIKSNNTSKSKSTSNKVKDGRKGKYQCNGHTHKTKEALNKCKNKK